MINYLALEKIKLSSHLEDKYLSPANTPVITNSKERHWPEEEEQNVGFGDKPKLTWQR